MPWSWSHTSEGIQAAKDNFFALPPEELREIWTEWRCMQHANLEDKIKHAVEKWLETDEDPDLGMGIDEVVDTYGINYCIDYDAYSQDMYAYFCEKWDVTIARLGEGFIEHLRESMWEWIEEHATCDRGGRNCWVCPSGCHTVPFEREENDDEQEI